MSKLYKPVNIVSDTILTDSQNVSMWQSYGSSYTTSGGTHYTISTVGTDSVPITAADLLGTIRTTNTATGNLPITQTHFTFSPYLKTLKTLSLGLKLKINNCVYTKLYDSTYLGVDITVFVKKSKKNKLKFFYTHAECTIYDDGQTYFYMKSSPIIMFKKLDDVVKYVKSPWTLDYVSKEGFATKSGTTFVTLTTVFTQC